MNTTTTVRLSTFIRQNLEEILQHWEDFAKTMTPSATVMDKAALRDHASQMLEAIAKDLDTPQSDRQELQKSKGQAPDTVSDTAAETHASARHLSGFSTEQLVAEYRALRASVLRLWASQSKAGLVTDSDDMTRFNEAIDQALAESIARYQALVGSAQNLFLAILGHDLRNPLGATIMGATYLMRAPNLDPKYIAVATRIFNSGQRMSGLVNDLIDYTRTHLGAGLPIVPRPCDLGQICQRVVDEMTTFHPGRTIELAVKGDMHGVWDEARMAQVVSNLVGNALQHGASTKPVRVAATCSKYAATIAVTNDGRAIPPDHLQSIFLPLVRLGALENAEDDTPGSMGLGLYITREIVMAHGGSIEVTSTESAGTSFVVTLPLTPVDSKPSPPAQPPGRTIAAPAAA